MILATLFHLVVKGYNWNWLKPEEKREAFVIRKKSKFQMAPIVNFLNKSRVITAQILCRYVAVPF